MLVAAVANGPGAVLAQAANRLAQAARPRPAAVARRTVVAAAASHPLMWHRRLPRSIMVEEGRADASAPQKKRAWAGAAATNNGITCCYGEVWRNERDTIRRTSGGGCGPAHRRACGAAPAGAASASVAGGSARGGDADRQSRRHQLAGAGDPVGRRPHLLRGPAPQPCAVGPLCHQPPVARLS